MSVSPVLSHDHLELLQMSAFWLWAWEWFWCVFCVRGTQHSVCEVMESPLGQVLCDVVWSLLHRALQVQNVGISWCSELGKRGFLLQASTIAKQDQGQLCELGVKAKGMETFMTWEHCSDSPGLPLAPSVWKFSFLSLFFFWASWKLLLFRWFSAHGSSPWLCMLSQRGECVGLQHVFICCPLDQLAACGFQVGSNQLVGLHSPFWVWAGVPFHSLWSSSCVDPGVSFLKYTTWSYKYRLQACRCPCMAVVSL